MRSSTPHVLGTRRQSGLDDAGTFDGRTGDEIEAEGNFGAGHLIFQGGRFHRRALEEQVSIRTPLAMHSGYGASRHATLHYYVQKHPDAVAMLVAGRFRRFDGTVPIFRSIESPPFLERFGRFRDRLPGGQLSLVPDVGPLADICEEARLRLDPPTKDVSIPDLSGTSKPFVAEAFFNQHCYFVMVTDKRARLLGRRARLAG